MHHITNLQGVNVNLFDHSFHIYSADRSNIKLPSSLLKVERFTPQNPLHKPSSSPIGILHTIRSEKDTGTCVVHFEIDHDAYFVWCLAFHKLYDA